MDAEDLKYDIVTKLRNDGVTRPKVYSPEALKALNAEPVKTAWGWDSGRPILNRLPMIGEGYQKSYSLDQASVYLDPTIPFAVGPGTLEVLKDQRNWRELTLQGGTITWEYGEITVEKEQIDITLLDNGRGLQDGEYQVGYRLFVTELEERDPYIVAFNNNAPVSGIEIAFDASGETTLHRSPFALTDDTDESWWPNAYYSADGYTVGTHFTLDLEGPLKAQAWKAYGDLGKTTASGALYVSDNAIIWYKRDQVTPDNESWNFDAQGDPYRYHRFFFWDGTVSINHLLYTGNGNVRDTREFVPDTSAELFIESMFESIDGHYILLATFTVRNGVLDVVNDHRKVTYEKYQPVSDWLTKFGDEQLRCRFNDVINYSTFFMNPVTADFQFYEEMDDSTCWGLGEIDLGNVIQTKKIVYPNEVALLESDVSPTMVEWIIDPEEDGDLVTPPYVLSSLSAWSLDNGLY